MADHPVGRVGEQVGPYRLIRLLGTGGFGEVYEVEHRLIQQRRAIKLLLERHFHDPKQRERFLREARTLAGLEHSSILPVLEVDEAGSFLYLVMPLYQRGTLSDLLKQQTTPLLLTEIEYYLTQICAALDYAHARGIAHLDLKPENLLLHEDGRLVLADFGLAHLLKQGRLEAGTSASWGTPYYMAPEQFRGEPEPRSDLYALGVILYQLLTLQRPFTGATPEAVMMQHVLAVPPALQAAYPAAPAALEPVIQKALAKQPADRYQTAGVLLLDFRAALGSAPAAATQPPVSAAASTPPMPSPALAVQPIVAARPNTPQAGPAECEIELPDGRLCGVPPIGRCSTCRRAFCMTHQGYNSYHYGVVPYVDSCGPCLAQAQTDAEEQERAAEAKRQTTLNEAHVYFESGAARAALLDAGVPTVEIYQVESRWKPKKGLFGQSGQYVERVTSLGRGWILGKISGEHTAHGEATSYTSYDTLLTAFLNLDRQVVFVCVEPYREGYKEAYGYLENRRVNAHGWIEAALAVKQLIRE